MPSFDPTLLPAEIQLTDFDMVARNKTTRGYPTVRAASRYRTGSFFFEITVDALDQGGFLLVGIGSLNVPENREYMPSEQYNSYGYSAAGELYALGEVVGSGYEHYQAGDKVGLICNLDKGILTFYLNSRQVRSAAAVCPAGLQAWMSRNRGCARSRPARFGNSRHIWSTVRLSSSVTACFRSAPPGSTDVATSLANGCEVVGAHTQLQTDW